MPDNQENPGPAASTDTASPAEHSRRNFLKGATYGVAGLAATSLVKGVGLSGALRTEKAAPFKSFSTTKPVTLTMWNQPTWANAVTERTFWTDLSNKFHKLNPNVTLNVDWISWDSSFSKDVAAIKSGSPPDIEQTGAEQGIYMASIGGVEPVDDLIDMFPLDKWTNQVKYFKWDGHYYGVPYLIGCYIFYYRKDLLEKKGFKSPPATWAEWLDVCKEITDPSSGVYGAGLDYTLGADSDQIFQGLIYAAGGEILNSHAQVAFDSPQTAAAYTWACITVPKAGVLPPGVTALTSPTSMATPLDTLYTDGRIGTAVRWGIEALTYQAYPGIWEKTGVALPPAGPSGHPGAFANDNPFWIFKGSKNVGWAKEFLRFFYEPANMVRLVEQSGWLPPYNGIQTSLDNEPWFKTMKDTMPYAVRFGFNYGPQAENGNAEDAFDLGRCAQAILLNKVPVNTALATYAKNLASIYKLPLA
ncbi:MAG TPA: extracellular solute-binding protein [Acidimicrobiales bacterium]|nr:extracellular solute-binding protein [Acidimicrobiales bacterium]